MLLLRIDMGSLVILGAAGFLGGCIIEQEPSFAIKAVVRKKPTKAFNNSRSVTWFELDISIPNILDSVLEKDDIVINTTYITNDDLSSNLILIKNIIDSCTKIGVSKLLHCSTADVVGNVKDNLINETIKCQPVTKYEKTKFAVEQALQSSVAQGLRVIIVRPTAIVGSDGKNLLKLINSLLTGSKIINYLRASLFKNRNMHLVSVTTVASAILHLLKLDILPDQNIYFISNDNDPSNNFISVETILKDALKIQKRRVPLIPIPLSFLTILLKIKGRSGYNVKRKFDSQKLIKTNFCQNETLSNTIYQLGKVRAINRDLY
jgi:nucleoside-diphosphate-sugar epimerase